MADRQDPSQYVFTGGPQDGIAALPNVDIVNDQLQRSPEGDYAEGSEMLELTPQPFADDVPDLLHEHPGRFYTQAPARTREVGKPRFVSSYGGAIITGDVLLGGFCFRETTETAGALIKLHDGADANAATVSIISLAPNESIRDWYLPSGIRFKYGLYVEVINGAIEGVLYQVEAEDVL